MFSPRCPAGGSSAAGAASLDPAQLAGAVDRFLALREFRSELYACLTSRADALFELADAVLCADHAVTSLVQLCLEPEFTRGHGALYDALAAGRIDDEKLFSLLASELPQAVDGPAARDWIAEHDVIDHGLLDKALAGSPRRCPAGADGAPGGPGCGSPSRRPPTPGRTRGAPRAGSTCTTAPATARLIQDRARLGVPVHRGDRPPAHRVGRARRRGAHRARNPHSADDRPGEERARPAARRRARVKAAPLFVFDAGDSAAALADGLLGCPVHVLVRLAAG